MSRRRKQQSRRPGGAPPSGRGRAFRPGVDPCADRAAADQLLRALTLGRPGPVAEAQTALSTVPANAVVDAARPLLEAMVATAWADGWQPVEAVWHVRRCAGAAAAQLLVALVAADAARVAAALHPAWRAQLGQLDVEIPEREAPVDPRWLVRAAGGALDGLVVSIVELVVVLGRLPRLQVLLPVPGRPDITLDAVGDDAGAAPSGIEPRVLERVRALLAKAEATTFEAEAQAFTAKAHELMTRHSLEHATVARPGSGPRSRPVARRLLLDDPYADAKALLVHVVAEASRCRAISQPGLQMSTVVGFESDVEAVEVLFTSLLVQAQTALQELARRSTAGSRERSRGFRSSFLRGFAHRIGDRLEAAGDAAVADVDRARGGALVPVLAAREAEVDEQMARLFPTATTRAGSRPVDALGYRAGSAAAERADLPWEHLASGA